MIDSLREFYGFSNVDYIAHANNDNERHKYSAKLYQGEYRGRQAATEMGAMQQQLSFSSHTECIV